MFMRVAVPLIILGIISLLVLAVIFWTHNQEKRQVEKDLLHAQNLWDGKCEFDNPETGAVCERTEFHLENHYHDVGGRLVHWP